LNVRSSSLSEMNRKAREFVRTVCGDERKRL
jgi:hypothetical protein